MKWKEWFARLFRSFVTYRVTEKDIRDWLDREGYIGSLAKLVELELHALARPGWRQIYRFSGQATRLADGEKIALFGVVEDDERINLCRITLYRSGVEQATALKTMSEGMIVRRPR